MMDTYGLQRKEIGDWLNKGLQLNDIILKWPYLKTPECLLQHFSVLMGSDCLTLCKENLSEISKNVLDFWKENKYAHFKTINKHN